MANDLVAPTQLPAHLAVFQQNTALTAVGSNLAALANGESHPRISIKASRFRLQDAQGEETMVPNLYLDVVVVDANPNNSKVYYAGVYNTAETEAKAPDCFSDNGIAPSSRAMSPQCGSCAACPHNVWGSKITPNGGQTKACSDSRKIAVIAADNPDGPVYELKVPPASIRNLVNYAKSLDQRQVPIPAVVTRLEFDPQSDYPKLTFKPTGWASPEHVAAVQELIGSAEVNACIGRDDKPYTANPAAAPALVPLAAQPAPVAAPPPPAPAPVQDMFAAALGTPAPAAIYPTAAQPAPVMEKPKRTRAKKAVEPQADFLATPQPVPQPAPIAANPVAQHIPVNPPLANNALDDLISNALKL